MEPEPVLNADIWFAVVLNAPMYAAVKIRPYHVEPSFLCAGDSVFLIDCPRSEVGVIVLYKDIPKLLHDGFCFRVLDQPHDPVFILLLHVSNRDGHPSKAGFALAPLMGQDGLDAVGCLFPLILGDCEEDGDCHAAVRRGCIVVLLNRFPRDPMCVEDLLDLEVFLNVSEPAVEAGEEDHVYLPFLDVLQQARHLRPLECGLAARYTRIDVVVDHLHFFRNTRLGHLSAPRPRSPEGPAHPSTPSRSLLPVKLPCAISTFVLS